MQVIKDPESDYYRAIGRVKSAWLGFEDHGILTFALDVDYGGGLTQGVGGFFLGQRDAAGISTERGKAKPWAGDCIIRLLRCFNVDRIDQIAGRTMYFLWKDARTHNVMPAGIEPLPTSHGERFLFNEIDTSHLAT